MILCRLCILPKYVYADGVVLVEVELLCTWTGREQWKIQDYRAQAQAPLKLVTY